MAKFRQIPRGGYLPDLIASEILAQIRSGQLAPNDRLPPEQDLAESFGVSRNAVREAIARLRSDGVIDTKPGRGAVVLPPSARSTFRIDPALLSDHSQVESLFELRGLLEIDAAGLAAQRRTDDDLDALQKALDDMQAAAEFDTASIEADARFHRCLGVATRNDYLAAIVDYISNRLTDTSRATKDVYHSNDLFAVTIREHQVILDAVRAADRVQARAAMARHIMGAADRLGVSLNADSLFRA